MYSKLQSHSFSIPWLMSVKKQKRVAIPNRTGRVWSHSRKASIEKWDGAVNELTIHTIEDPFKQLTASAQRAAYVRHLESISEHPISIDSSSGRDLSEICIWLHHLTTENIFCHLYPSSRRVSFEAILCVHLLWVGSWNPDFLCWWRL